MSLAGSKRGQSLHRQVHNARARIKIPRALEYLGESTAALTKLIEYGETRATGDLRHITAQICAILTQLSMIRTHIAIGNDHSHLPMPNAERLSEFESELEAGHFERAYPADIPYWDLVEEALDKLVSAADPLPNGSF